MINSFELIEAIKNSINVYFPNQEILSIKDRGEWIRRIVEVEFSDGTSIFYKIITNQDWSDNIHEVNVTKIFTKNSLPIPKLLVVDDSCDIIPFPYIVQEKVRGIKLGDLLTTLPNEEILLIYEAIGQVYRKMHSEKNDKSGLWGKDPYQVRYPISPNDYMYQAEIVNGSGQKALERGLISQKLYDDIVSIWKDNLDYLKDHIPSMIHVSPFIWNIYLDKVNDQWQVIKLMSLGDVSWWDPGYDLAAIKYPPYAEYSESRWNAFLKGYQDNIDEKRILLYSLMHKLCASMGVYMEPTKFHNDEWIKNTLNELELVVNKIKLL